MRLILFAALLAVAACSPVGQSANNEASGKRHALVIGDIQDVDNLNPHLAAALPLSNMSQMTMAYLVRYDAHNRPMPELATAVPTQQNGGISRDGKAITWHLRHGVKWSDGKPFDADDVVFSTNAVNNAANNETGRDGWELIKKMDEPDRYTVVFHLKKPYSAYLPTFFGSAGANPCILPKHLLGSLKNINNAPYNSKPVGIGPFRYVRWVRGDQVEMEANPYYWRGEPKLKSVLYRIIPDRNTMLNELRTGEIDVWPYVSSVYVGQAAQIDRARLYRGPGSIYAHLDFNTRHAPLTDVTVRRALRLATDRRTLQAKGNHGVGIVQESEIPPVSPFYEPVPFVETNIPAANAMLDRAGWKRGADGVRAKGGLRLALTAAIPSGGPDVDQRLEIIRSTWQQIGATFTIKHYGSALFFSQPGGTLYRGTWDITAFAWGSSPDGNFTDSGCANVPPNGQNVTRLCDPAIDAALIRAKISYDDGARRTALTEAMHRISDRVPFFVLFIAENVHGATKQLTGWHPNSVTPFDDMMNVDL